MNIHWEIVLSIWSILCVYAVKIPNQLATSFMHGDFYLIYLVRTYTFKSRILICLDLKGIRFFWFYDAHGVKLLLTHLRLDFNNLKEDKLRHKFNDIITSMYLCAKEPSKRVSTITCVVSLIYWLELPSDIWDLNESLNQVLEKTNLKILLYKLGDFPH